MFDEVSLSPRSQLATKNKAQSCFVGKQKATTRSATLVSLKIALIAFVCCSRCLVWFCFSFFVLFAFPANLLPVACRLANTATQRDAAKNQVVVAVAQCLRLPPLTAKKNPGACLC